MTEQKAKMSPLVGVGIGCLVILVLLGIGFSVFMKFFAQKAGSSLVESFIESKTGVKADIDNLEDGKMEFTDPETGQTVNIGSKELPATFPSDFPVYSNATVAGSVSGSQEGYGKGMFVTFTTQDALDSVVAFYTKELPSRGWEATSSFNTNEMKTWAVTKGDLEGSVSITTADGTTTIMVTLGEKQ